MMENDRTSCIGEMSNDGEQNRMPLLHHTNCFNEIASQQGGSV